MIGPPTFTVLLIRSMDKLIDCLHQVFEATRPTVLPQPANQSPP